MPFSAASISAELVLISPARSCFLAVTFTALSSSLVNPRIWINHAVLSASAMANIIENPTRSLVPILAVLDIIFLSGHVGELLQSLKSMVNVLIARTGFPSDWNGRNFHFFTASIAGLTRTGFPRNVDTLSTAPSGEIVASTSTEPSILKRFAVSGYSGGLFEVLALRASAGGIRFTSSARRLLLNKAMIVRLALNAQIQRMDKCRV